MLVHILTSRMRVYHLLLGCCIVFFSFTALDDPLQQLLQKQDVFAKSHPQEKIHLHTDKPYYSIGDTVYFKAYVLNAAGNLPSEISRVLHVELIDGRMTVVQSGTFPIEDGTARGTAVLHDQLSEGSYTIRAYTSWMRNYDESFFYHKTIPVGNALQLKPDNKKPVSLQVPAAAADIRFLPESGQLVNGLRSRVGFKAVSADGLGMDVSGDVVDQDGSTLTSFHSGFGGIGSFELTPVAGKTYQAVVRFLDGKEKKLPLPQAVAQGYVLSVNSSQPGNLSITIAANQAASGTEVVLVALSNNTVQYVGKTKLNETATASSMLSKKRFPAGILQLTLFDAGYRPVAERLVFIRQNDQLALELSTASKTYRTREKVKLSLHATDADGDDIAGSFSVAVTDESKAPFKEEEQQSIFSNLLLSADIRGYIQTPNYYFTSITPQKEKELDDLLLTQGWRRFTWNEILAGKQAALPFAAEKSLSVSGRVTTTKGEPVPYGTITLLSRSGNGFIIDTTTGPDGRFRFDDLQHTDSLNFSLQAKSSTGSSQVQIELDRTAVPTVTAPQNRADVMLLTGESFTTFLQSSHRRFEEMARYTNLKGATVLKPVTVATTKLSKVQEAVKESWNLNGPGNADQILTYLDIANCNDIAMCLQGKVLGVVVKRTIDPVTKAPVMLPYSTRGTGRPMLIIVDGMITASPSLGDIPAADIQSIEVLRSGAYLPVYGTKGAQGVMVITTKSGKIDYNEGTGAASGSKQSGNTIFGTSQGYTAAREFYTPDYSVAAKTGAMQDLRSTVFWKPDLITDEEGNASVEFYNADGTGSYKVIVEGISADGKLGRQIFYYEVR